MGCLTIGLKATWRAGLMEARQEGLAQDVGRLKAKMLGFRIALEIKWT